MFNSFFDYLFSSDTTIGKSNTEIINILHTNKKCKRRNTIPLNTDNNNLYYFYSILFISLSIIYFYKKYNSNKNTPKQLIYKHFTKEIKQHILRSRISALYFMAINMFTITLQFGVIYLACPDLFKLIGIIDNSNIDYEGYSNTINYIMSSTAEFTNIIISYIPIISQAVVFINSIINISLTFIGLYIFYKIFISIILKSLWVMIQIMQNCERLNVMRLGCFLCIKAI